MFQGVSSAASSVLVVIKSSFEHECTIYGCDVVGRMRNARASLPLEATQLCPTAGETQVDSMGSTHEMAIVRSARPASVRPLVDGTQHVEKTHPFLPASGHD